MFIKVEDILINTRNITSINKSDDDNNAIVIHFTNKNRVFFRNTTINEIEQKLKKINKAKKSEDKLNRFEIMDL